MASFAATKADQLMLVTDQAKLIRIGLDSLRVIGRGSAGVRLFDVAKDEHVVSAVRIDEQEEPENDAEEAIVGCLVGEWVILHEKLFGFGGERGRREREK